MSRSRRGRRPGVTIFLLSGVDAIETLIGRRSVESDEASVRGLLAEDAGRARSATATITIARPVDEVYRFFRDFRNFPRFMAHLDSVETDLAGRSRWVLRTVAGRTVTWDAEIVEERPGELLLWRSLPGADVDNRGVVRFRPAPGGRGTEIHADIRYAAPGGRIGIAFAKLFGFEPGQQARGDLRRLKQVLETGEVVHSDASIYRLPHAAKPPTDKFVEAHTQVPAGEAA